ncbi:hypothetical protein GCM10007870_07470 [Gluconobacter kondonii]|uniref:Uncharacterized protein n=1 Tax=Gluconobacter kondonii TaxID=941463 RepID=A0ABQ5WPK2_9PROT|nr:hypothetical protein AA3266_1691 [Gluconobacter kondonii NBRC 3266]GLQ65163.1 hypothetical protein GCM10007870_07470 [Gluconobacter kondonii]
MGPSASDRLQSGPEPDWRANGAGASAMSEGAKGAEKARGTPMAIIAMRNAVREEERLIVLCITPYSVAVTPKRKARPTAPLCAQEEL